jgi:cardiolipin synthase
VLPTAHTLFGPSANTPQSAVKGGTPSRLGTTVLHQKIMTVDGVWSAIGSSNFDDRSFETNDELSLSISDEALAARLDAIFERYVKRAHEVELQHWVSRGWWHKLKDNAYYLVNELL